MVWLGLSCGFSTRLGQTFWLGVSQSQVLDTRKCKAAKDLFVGHNTVRAFQMIVYSTFTQTLEERHFNFPCLQQWQWSALACGQCRLVMTRYWATSRGSTNTNNSPLALQLRQQSVILFSTLPLDHCSTQWIVWQKQQGKYPTCFWNSDPEMNVITCHLVNRNTHHCSLPLFSCDAREHLTSNLALESPISTRLHLTICRE